MHCLSEFLRITAYQKNKSMVSVWKACTSGLVLFLLKIDAMVVDYGEGANKLFSV